MAETETKPETTKVEATKTGGKDMALKTKAKEGATESATKAAPKAKTKAKKEVSEDLIVQTVFAVENIKETEVSDLVKELIEEGEFNNFKIGGFLSKMQEEDWFSGHESFKDYITDEFGMHYRKAMYLVQIYRDLVESGVKWDDVKSVGWTKLKEIAHLLNEENVEEWVEKANSMTCLQLIETVKSLGGTDEGGDDGAGDTGNTVTTLTFKVHTDQKEIIEAAVAKQMKTSGTEYNTVALEYICQQFLENGLGKGKGKGKQKTLKELMEEVGPDDTLNTFAALYPNIDIEVAV
jgi:hypothetical protein